MDKICSRSFFYLFTSRETVKNYSGKGYTDAFVVNVNQEKKFEEEVVSVNNLNIKATSVGKV